MEKQQIRLKVIPEPDPDERVVLSRPLGLGTVLFTGSDPSAPDICCGGCGGPIIMGMPQTFVNFVFQCGVCGAFNDLTP
jgi:hypothetical protein